MTRHPEERRREAPSLEGQRGDVVRTFEARAPRGHLGMTATVVMTCTLAACNMETGTGFVQIRTIPASTTISQPALYFDSTKLDPLRHGEAVLTRKVGTTKLQAEAAGGQLAPLCNIVVKKNRITTV